MLKLYLGARKMIWLGDGFADDETDGHIDNIACFAAPGRVIVGIPATKPSRFRAGPGSLAPAENGARRRRPRLRDRRAAAAAQERRQSWSGTLLPASYVNFYLVNGGVIMPAFDDPNDEPARTILAQCFPDRDIMQIDALDIVQGGGGIHCITQQEPYAVSATVTVAVAQFACTWDKPPTSPRPRTWCALRPRAAPMSCVLPELFATPYFCQDQSADHFALAASHSDGNR